MAGRFSGQSFFDKRCLLDGEAGGENDALWSFLNGVLGMRRRSLMLPVVVGLIVWVCGREVMAESPAVVKIDARVAEYLKGRSVEFDRIEPARQRELEALAEHVRGDLKGDGKALLTFVCTHNSRRSHLAQIWAAAGAAYYGVQGIETFSGGTEATAMNPRTVAALRRAGLRVETAEPLAENPRYEASFAEGVAPMECFSKVYDSSPNPTVGYAAVMTCAQADQGCPVVRGADFRIAIRYDDPKVSDGTPAEESTYDQRCQQIAREMLYLMSRVHRR